jgi:hypothetical protein
MGCEISSPTLFRICKRTSAEPPTHQLTNPPPSHAPARGPEPQLHVQAALALLEVLDVLVAARQDVELGGGPQGVVPVLEHLLQGLDLVRDEVRSVWGVGVGLRGAA